MRKMLIVMIAIAAGLAAGCEKARKFRIGDCVELDVKWESWETPMLPRRIVEYGREAYRLEHDGTLSYHYEDAYRLVGCKDKKP